MSLIVLGQLLGISFACGLNLYLTVAVLGIVARFEFATPLPPGLHGLSGLIVISSALALYLVEAVVDKIRHADSLWDTVHTLIRPPAAALLAFGALWGAPPPTIAAGTSAAFLVALAAHGTKAGLRIALNAAVARGQTWYSLAEDILAIGFALLALLDPEGALLATAAVLLVVLLVGPRFWRAFHLGLRCLAAWIRAFFAPARWRDLHGLKGVGAYRNGWLVVTTTGPLFGYRTVFGYRRVDLTPPDEVAIEPGVWADIIRARTGTDTSPDYTLYILKDGPALAATVDNLSRGAA